MMKKTIIFILSLVVLCSVVFAADKPYGGYAVFDGVDDYVALPNDMFDSLTEGSTEMAWVYLPQTQSSSFEILTNGVIGGNAACTLLIQSDARPKFYCQGSTSAYVCHETSNVALEREAWNHVAVVHKSDNLIIYINGQEVSSTWYNQGYSGPSVCTLKGNSGSTNSNTIGALRYSTYTNGHYFFKGSLDDVIVFNEALSSEDINDIYQRGINGLKSDVTTGLFSYWDFETYGTEQDPYDDKHGSNDGTPYNDVYATEHIGGVGVFDGVNDYIQDSDFSEDLTDMTMLMWVNTEQHSHCTERGLLSFLGAGYAQDFLILTGQNCGFGAISQDKIGFTDSVFSANKVETSWDSSWDNNWIFVGVTCDDSACKLYINGDEKASATLSSREKTSQGGLEIGKVTDSGSNLEYLKGHMDELMIFSRVLDETEIEEVYNLGIVKYDSGLEDDSDLVLYWPMDEDFNDDSGENNHGSANGAFTTNFIYEPNGVSIDNFDVDTYGTTDLSEEDDHSAVSNFKLATSAGSIEWTNDVDVRGSDFDANVAIGTNFASIDADKLDEDFNKTATIELQIDSCDLVSVYYSAEHKTDFYPDTDSDWNLASCGTVPAQDCEIVSCTDGSLTLEVAHFDGWGAEGEENQNGGTAIPEFSTVGIIFVLLAIALVVIVAVSKKKE